MDASSPTVSMLPLSAEPEFTVELLLCVAWVVLLFVAVPVASWSQRAAAVGGRVSCRLPSLCPVLLCA